MMMRQAVDRSRPTRGGLATSTAVHALLLLFLAIAIKPQAAMEMAEELTKISYVEAHLGDNVAEQVRLKTLAKRTPPSIDAGRGISTRSAQKPATRPEPKKLPDTRPQPRELTEANPSLPTPSERPRPQLEANQTLQSRDDALAAVDLPTERNRTNREALDTSAPKLTQRSGEVPSVSTEGPSLKARDGGLSVVGGDLDPSPRGAGTRDVADAGSGAVPNGGSLKSNGRASYESPGSSLTPSRSGGRSIAGAGNGGAIAPPPGSGSEGGGRRTILDYGSGGGGGGLRSRGGGAAPAPDRDVNPGRNSQADKGLAEASPVELDQNGTGMSITGEIAGRKIVKVVAPDYSDRAKRQGWEGVVGVHFTVLPDGRVKDNTWVKQMSPHSDLNRAAMDAIKKFKFAPLPKGEAQVEQWGVITFVFRLK